MSGFPKHLPRTLREGDIADQLERQRTPGSISQKLSDFVVRQVDREKWEIEFKNNGVDGYRLQAKRGEIRQFVRIAGVERWMKKMGIKEFKVVLDD